MHFVIPDFAVETLDRKVPKKLPQVWSPDYNLHDTDISLDVK